MMKLLLLLPVVLAQTTLQTTTFYEVDGYTTMISSSCSSSQYYDSSSQKCRDCGSNQVPDFSAVDALGDATGCKCSDGYYKVFNDCSSVSYKDHFAHVTTAVSVDVFPTLTLSSVTCH